jgi:prevent-host-death family protein
MREMMNVHAAKTNLSKLLARVASGEEIVIAKGGVPVAMLVPYGGEAQPRPLGVFAGRMWVSDDAFETPVWLLDAFEGVGGELPLPTHPAAAAPPRPAHVAEPARHARSRGPKRRKG